MEHPRRRRGSRSRIRLGARISSASRAADDEAPVAHDTRGCAELHDCGRRLRLVERDRQPRRAASLLLRASGHDGWLAHLADTPIVAENVLLHSPYGAFRARIYRPRDGEPPPGFGARTRRALHGHRRTATDPVCRESRSQRNGGNYPRVACARGLSRRAFKHRGDRGGSQGSRDDAHRASRRRRRDGPVVRRRLSAPRGVQPGYAWCDYHRGLRGRPSRPRTGLALSRDRRSRDTARARAHARARLWSSRVLLRARR